MRDDKRGTNPIDEFAKGHWPQDIEYKRDGHSGYYKTLTSGKKITHSSEFKDALEKTAYGIVDLVYQKHLDYGSKAINNSPYGKLQGVVVRLHDKFSRAVNLTKTVYKTEPKNESLKDTFIDIVGYALIAITILDDNFPES